MHGFLLLCLSAFAFQDSKPASAPAPGAARTVPPGSANISKSGDALDRLISTGIEQLLAGEDNGSWPYEGVYRDPEDRSIPIGYRVGGTAIVCDALLHAAKLQDTKAAAAIDRGLRFILANLPDPKLATSRADVYDVRIWGQSWALEILCRLESAGRLGAAKKEAESWIPKLIQTIVDEEIEGGGWHYATRKCASPFVTCPVAQTLLYARSIGHAVDDAVLRRAAGFLARCRLDTGAFVYDERLLKTGQVARDQIDRADRTAKIPGAIGRSPASEATLALLGEGNVVHIKKAVSAFFEHWQQLEDRRARKGTHEGPYLIAPYYVYYAHRYAAQAIELLPASERETARDTLLQYILKTRDDSGGWNDRVFPRSRAYGTAMVLMALLRDRAPQIPARGPAAEKIK
jgi:hypothetical protein